MARFSFLLLFIAFFSPAAARTETFETIPIKDSLPVIQSFRAFQITSKKNPWKSMADISRLIPTAIIDLKYASADNFLKKKVYPKNSKAYLRIPALQSLMQVQFDLNQRGLGLKIWDAYRPYAVTVKMWEAVKDERYAANPKYGSGHNRGIAVDLTIIDTVSLQELDMGTGFDHFSDTAHHGFQALPQTVKENRMLLRMIMEKHGFKALETEWWQYYLPDVSKYELLNLSFRHLSRLKYQHPLS